MKISSNDLQTQQKHHEKKNWQRTHKNETYRSTGPGTKNS